MSRALLKSTFRSIKHTFSRFISIVIIMAIGISFYVGFKSTGPDMRITAQKYFIDNNLMDIRVQSTLGLTPFDLRDIAKIEGVDYIMPSKFADGLVWINGEVESDIDGSQFSARAYSLNINKFANFNKSGENDGNFINRPTLIEGSYPTEINQCLVDRSKLSTPDSYKIGNIITLDTLGDDDSIFASLSVNEFEIVGVIESPYYLSFERGNTLIGTGKLSTFIYVPEEAFVTDYYTEVYITIEGANDLDPFSDEYFNLVRPVMNELKILSQERLLARANDINLKLPPEIKSGEKELEAKRKDANERFKDSKKELDNLKKLVDEGDLIYLNAKKEFDTTFGEIKDEIEKGSSDLQQQIDNYNYQNNMFAQAKAEWNAANTALNEINRKTAASFIEFDRLESQLRLAEKAAETTQQLLNTTEEVFKALALQQQEQLSDPGIQNIIGVFEDLNPELFNSIKGLTAQGLAFEAMEYVRPYIDQYRIQLSQQEEEIRSLQKRYNDALPEVNRLRSEIEKADIELEAKRKVLDETEIKLQKARQVIDSYGSKLSNASNEMLMNYTTAQGDLILLKGMVDSAPENYEKMKAIYDERVADAQKEIKLAQTKIKSAKDLLGRVAEARWNIFNRNDTPGYTTYENAINTIEVVSDIFPAFFILVAILISLTTITRMVEEERPQFGTLFALGYKPSSIALKYVLYALFAGIIGSMLGLSFGFYALPKIIFFAWSIIFEMPSLVITYPWLYTVIGILVSIFATVTAALLASRKDIKVNPAALMRPKAPPQGKRVFLERIKFIWNKISFSSKVTVRNLLRNKRRFLMTLVGMSGCTALLLASTGFFASVDAIMTKQFGKDGIAKYDIQFAFAKEQDPKNSEVMAAILKDNRIDSLMLTSMLSLEGGSDRTSFQSEVYLYTPQDPSQLGKFVKLQNRKQKGSLVLGDEDVFVTEEFARSTNTQVGDSIFVKDIDGNRTDFTVSAIVENYTFNYIYISPNVYKQAYGVNPEYSYAVGLIDQNLKDSPEASSAKVNLATDLMKHEQINAVGYTTDIMDQFNEIIRTLLFIVALLIGAAIILAIVVLYNLSNININERKRELATLKVLGFYDKEVSSYVHRENIITTLISTVLGLGMGVALHRLIINFTKIDMVMFGRSIHWMIYIIAVVLSISLSLLISFIMRKKLRNVNMVESFKTVE